MGEYDPRPGKGGEVEKLRTEIAQRDARIGELNLRLGNALAEIERLRANTGTCPRCGATIVGTVTDPRDAEIERLRAFANSFGVCTCQPGRCDTKYDFQCRAREALSGVNNEQTARETDK